MFEHLRVRGDSSHGCQDVPGLVERFVLLVIPCVLLTTEAGVEKEEEGASEERRSGSEERERGTERIGGKEEGGRRKEGGEIMGEDRITCGLMKWCHFSTVPPPPPPFPPPTYLQCSLPSLICAEVRKSPF